MFKKSISLILVLLISLFMAMPAAATDDSLTDAQAAAAVKVGISALVAEDDDATVEVSEDLSDKIIADADTPEEISRAIAQFVFIEKEKVEELSSALVNDCKYTVVVTADGKDTVYVAVDLLAHPEIYDARVFLSVVDKLTDKCDEYAISNGIDTTSDNYAANSYYHLAGELAMHMMLADMTEIMGASTWNTFLKDIYERSIVADLNIDESRVPFGLVEFFGRVLTFIFDVLFG